MCVREVESVRMREIMRVVREVEYENEGDNACVLER